MVDVFGVDVLKSDVAFEAGGLVVPLDDDGGDDDDDDDGGDDGKMMPASIAPAHNDAA